MNNLSIPLPNNSAYLPETAIPEHQGNIPSAPQVPEQSRSQKRGNESPTYPTSKRLALRQSRSASPAGYTEDNPQLSLEEGTIWRLYPENIQKDFLSDLDKALATQKLAIARQLLEKRQSGQPATEFWKEVVKNKHAPEQQDLLRALLILDRDTATILAKLRQDGEAGTTVSALHAGIWDKDSNGRYILNAELRACLREFPYHSEKRPETVNTNGRSNWDCKELAIMWTRQRHFSANGKSDYSVLADEGVRNEKGDLATAQRLSAAIWSNARQCYPVLIEPSGDPSQKTFGDFLADQFKTMSPGKTKQFHMGTSCHAMSLELKKKLEGSKDILIVNWYDPNDTNVHMHAQTERLEVVRREWNVPAFLSHADDKALYFEQQDRYIMIAEIVSWPELDEPAPAWPNGREVSSLDYIDAHDTGHLLFGLARRGFDKTLSDRLQSMPMEKAMQELMIKLNEGSTPLIAACRNGYANAVKTILQFVHKNEQSSAFHGYGLTAQLGAQSNRGSTPILMASAYGHGEIIEVILSYMWNHLSVEEQFSLLSTGDSSGFTALHVACEFDYAEIVEKICNFLQDGEFPREHIASVLGAKNGEGMTPLHRMCTTPYAKSITPFFRCMETSELSSEQMESIMNAQDRQGMTPLLLACASGNLDAVEAILNELPEEVVASLLMHEVVIEDKGWSPLALAKATEHDRIVQTIRDYGNENPDIGNLLRESPSINLPY
jgi:ankyrin repeat protein